MLNKLIKSLLNEEDNEVKREFFHTEIDPKRDTWDSEEVREFKKKLSDNSITFKLEDRYGGEDQGSDYWSVYSFSNDKEVVFIKFDGWYASYEGSTYEEFYEVQAVEKTITVFEKK